MNPYNELSNAIIVQAVKDYRDVVLWLKAHQPICKEDKQDVNYISAIADKASIEQFFLGDWFSTLTKLHGKTLLAKLKREVA